MESKEEIDRRRILIVSASMGAGHDGVALELQRRLEDLGHVATVCDYLGALPARLGYLLRFLYALQLYVVPATYEAVYQLTTRFRFAYFVAFRIALLGCSRLNQWARGYDLIVATYPMAGQALGHLRKVGLSAQVVIFLTDFSVHPLWVSRYADLHVTLAKGPAEQVAVIEPSARVEVAGAVVGADFMSVHTENASEVLAVQRVRSIARQPIVLLAAGSWGVGQIRQVAEELRSHGFPMPLIVCGGNRRLRNKLRRKRLGIALGWVDDMASLMETADVLVHNAGGLMTIEALAIGLPVVGYRCIPGHGCANSEAMAKAGVALHACSEDSVVGVLRSLDSSIAMSLSLRASELFSEDPAKLILSLVCNPTSFESVVGQGKA